MHTYKGPIENMNTFLSNDHSLNVMHLDIKSANKKSTVLCKIFKNHF